MTLTAEDIREGLVGVLSVFLAEPQFQGQTKDRLNNPEAQAGGRRRGAAGAGAVAQRQPHASPSRSSHRIILAARAREASRAARAVDHAKDGHQRPAHPAGQAQRLHLAATAATRELFIVEGDSAGGSAKQGRDRTRQAILPLRGKVLNTESVTLAKVLENKELSDLVTALGCGMGKSFDPRQAALRSHHPARRRRLATATTSPRCC